MGERRLALGLAVALLAFAGAASAAYSTAAAIAPISPARSSFLPPTPRKWACPAGGA
jgi:hypothetical protein